MRVSWSSRNHWHPPEKLDDSHFEAEFDNELLADLFGENTTDQDLVTAVAAELKPLSLTEEDNIALMNLREPS